MKNPVAGISGTRIGSKGHRPAQTEPLHLSPNNLEAQITALFAPWLVEDVPEEKWATLQEKLDRIVRGIISGKNLLEGKTNDANRHKA